ncbi:2Fe-2S iron-sulfur cluster-binding protein [Tamlana sp. I1]|uniref:2Fe-2S iron-sulfur cluster-binding protein n=1 Tax=Tamlana sp. I1 TaxID=2762061 RepID=UPI00188E811E|nr:2Fe-2S iron-sulfur cluster-binding protein [Tamlana sp. I1]
MYTIHIEDSNGVMHNLNFEPNTTQNLMVFIADTLAEEIGDCRGRAWCGTCMIQLMDGDYTSEKIGDEQLILNQFPDIPNTRLACQVFLSVGLHNTTWKVLDSRQFI